MFLTYQKFICLSQQAIFFYYRVKKLLLLITSCRSSLFSSEAWHSPAGGRFNLPVSDYNTIKGYVSIIAYYMARQIRAFWLVLSWPGFHNTVRFRGNGHKLRILLFSKAGIFKTNMAREPYNKLLTNLASSSRTKKFLTIIGRSRAKYRNLSVASWSLAVICRSRRLRQIIDWRDTD